MYLEGDRENSELINGQFWATFNHIAFIAKNVKMASSMKVQICVKKTRGTCNSYVFGFKFYNNSVPKT